LSCSLFKISTCEFFSAVKVMREISAPPPSQTDFPLIEVTGNSRLYRLKRLLVKWNSALFPLSRIIRGIARQPLYVPSTEELPIRLSFCQPNSTTSPP